MNPITPSENTHKQELSDLKNVGKATLQDLHVLGITSVQQLGQQNPDYLYQKLQQVTGSKQDPCVWDIFAAIIHQAQTGQALPWWYFSKLRKNLKSGTTLPDFLKECTGPHP